MVKTKVEGVEEKELKSSVVRAPSFVQIYATNTLVTVTRDDLRIEVFNERFRTADGWTYRSEGALILTRAAAKRLAAELARKVKEYEDKHGDIQAAEELEKMNYVL